MSTHCADRTRGRFREHGTNQMPAESLTTYRYLDPAGERESRRTFWRASPTTAIDLWWSTTVRIA